MSLSSTTLSAIQQAGQALHQATVVVSDALREQAEHMVATVASQPFEAEGEQAIANFKMLARLSQDLQSLEQQLRSLYGTASELASPEMDVVAALPHTGNSRRSAAGKESVEDVVAKPARQRRAKRGKAKPQATGLTGNDSRLLAYLQSALNSSSWTALTGAAMAKGSGLPLGSVGVSLKKILAGGAVKKSGRSNYKLLA